MAFFTALALLFGHTSQFPLKFGHRAVGCIVCDGIPIFIVAFRWGLKGGLLSGFLWGILQVATGEAYILTPLQGFIDYAIGLYGLGFAGIFCKTSAKIRQRRQNKSYISHIFRLESFARVRSYVFWPIMWPESFFRVCC